MIEKPPELEAVLDEERQIPDFAIVVVPQLAIARIFGRAAPVFARRISVIRLEAAGDSVLAAEERVVMP